MENKYSDAVIGALTIAALTLLMLALSSGGMYFIENLSIQFFGEEPSPALNLWVIGLSTIALPAFILYTAWAISRENAKAKESKPAQEEKRSSHLALESVPVGFGGVVSLGGMDNTIILNQTGEVPLDEMEDGERILYKCFRYEGGAKHVFYRVLVKFTDEEDGPLLRDDRDSDMDWDQEGTKCFGAWGFIDVRDITNHDDGSKYKEVPY